VHAYAFLLCQIADGPSVEAGRHVNDNYIFILNEWFPDDVHRESLAVLQVPNRVFDAAQSALVAFEWGERRVVRELWEVISDEETCVCVLLTMLNQLMDAS
jgi:hypothetical protein